MKKIIFIITIAANIIISACSKGNSEELIIDVQKVQEVLDFRGHPGSRIAAFNILNPAEKAFAFKKHIQGSYLKMNLNQEQIDFVKKAIEMIVPEMYIKGSDDHFAGKIATFGYQATKLFSLLDYVRLFQNLQQVEDLASNTNGKAAPSDCFCEWDSTCSAYADTKGPDCITGQNGCKETNGGCGWLWLSNCRGDCGRK